VIEKHVVRVRRRPLDASKLGYFRYGRLGDKVVLTNDAGEWLLLAQGDFDALLAGQLTEAHPQWADLSHLGFVRADIDVEALAGRIRRKKAFLGRGPHLHVVVVTLRCNQSCSYCHASRAPMSRTETDMSLETAKGVVDMAMSSSSPTINFEYQGGEPTVNMDVIRFMVEYSREKNRHEGKELVHSVVTNFTAMTEEIAEWMLTEGIMVCTSLDGPADLHDANRPLTGAGAAYATVLNWMGYFNRRYVEMGLDPELWHVDALLTTTRPTLSRWKEVVDLYVGLGIRNIHLRPLNPYGFAAARWKQLGYSVEEFLDFYARALDYIIELNLDGVEVMEGTAATLLTKILTPDDPNYVDIRSPCGAATGQVAYDHDGTVFPCDEARMLAAMGDPFLQLGTVQTTTMPEVLTHPTVRAMAVASITDALPMCSTCWNAPFCGVCPVHSYKTHGDLFGQRVQSPLCKSYMTMSALLLEKLGSDEDGRIEKILRRWVIQRPRSPAPGCEG